ncbi:MAG: hypothetical protein Q8R79_08080 [Legionellaceae bacterium]|nr:hypothetical protein [Legionellaceae bacterium]
MPSPIPTAKGAQLAGAPVPVKSNEPEKGFFNKHGSKILMFGLACVIGLTLGLVTYFLPPVAAFFIKIMPFLAEMALPVASAIVGVMGVAATLLLEAVGSGLYSVASWLKSKFTSKPNDATESAPVVNATENNSVTSMVNALGPKVPQPLPLQPAANFVSSQQASVAPENEPLPGAEPSFQS